MTRAKGYKLPVTIETDNACCIRAYVPNRPEYICAFWGSYEYLATWLAWECDDDKRGKEAAAVWKPLVEQSRTEWLLGDCSCGIAPPIDEVDPIDLLANTLYGMKTLLDWVNEWLNDGKSTEQIVSYLVFLTPHFPSLSDMIDEMADMSYEDRTSALSAWDWEAMFDAVWCDTGCSLSDYGGLFGFVGWSQCAMSKALDYIGGVAGDVSDWLATCITDALSYFGLNRLAELVPNGGELFGFDEPLCPFTHTFDFTVASYGWEQSDRWGEEWECGAWSSGVGWSGTDTLPSSWHRRHLVVRRQFADTYITKVTVYYTRSCGTFTVSDWMDTQRAYLDGSYSGDNERWNSSCDTGPSWEVSHNKTSDELEVWLSCCKANIWDGSITLTKVVVEGLGDDPF